MLGVGGGGVLTGGSGIEPVGDTLVFSAIIPSAREAPTPPPGARGGVGL